MHKAKQTPVANVNAACCLVNCSVNKKIFGYDHHSKRVTILKFNPQCHLELISCFRDLAKASERPASSSSFYCKNAIKQQVRLDHHHPLNFFQLEPCVSHGFKSD